MREQVYDQHRSWIEINLAALRYNVEHILKLLDDPKQLMAVVKADAYGHGAVRISQELNQMGITSFAVATLAEAIELRKNNIKGDILILGYTNPQDVWLLNRYDITQTILDQNYAFLLEEKHIDVKVHIAIDSGMHRIGELYDHIQSIENILKYPHLHITGMFTHLCVCDEMTVESQGYTYQQIHSFLTLVNELKENYDVGSIHILSSYGFIYYPEYLCDYVRMGILLYGVDSSFPKQTFLSLKPVLSLKSKVALIKEVSSQETIGYGRTYMATKPMRIAVVPIGYADGIPRELSNCGEVIINGKKTSIVGRICMDQMMVDITSIDDVRCGDIVTIIGEDGVVQGVEMIAKQAHTISNEILSQIGMRLPKIYLE